LLFRNCLNRYRFHFLPDVLIDFNDLFLEVFPLIFITFRAVARPHS